MRGHRSTGLCDSHIAFHVVQFWIERVILISDTRFSVVVQGFNLIPDGCVVRSFQKSLQRGHALKASVGSIPVVEMLPFLELFGHVQSVRRDRAVEFGPIWLLGSFHRPVEMR